MLTPFDSIILLVEMYQNECIKMNLNIGPKLFCTDSYPSQGKRERTVDLKITVVNKAGVDEYYRPHPPTPPHNAPTPPTPRWDSTGCC